VIDGTKLREQFRAAVMACLGITAVPFLLSYVGFVLTESVPFFAACVAFTLVGFAYSFPRWSRWEALLVELGLVSHPETLTVG